MKINEILVQEFHGVTLTNVKTSDVRLNHSLKYGKNKI